MAESGGDDMRLLVVLWFLSACTIEPPPLRPGDQEAFDAAEQGWLAAGLPDPHGCLEGARALEAESDRDFKSRCSYPSSLAAACLTTYHAQRGPRIDWGWLAVLEPGATDQRRLIIHEAMHALVSCTGLAPDRYDYDHVDPRVWAVGGETSAELRAIGGM